MPKALCWFLWESVFMVDVDGLVFDEIFIQVKNDGDTDACVFCRVFAILSTGLLIKFTGGFFSLCPLHLCYGQTPDNPQS
jgi:hypothetical protein